MKCKDTFYEITVSQRDKLYPKEIVELVDSCVGEILGKTPTEIEMMANPSPIFYDIRDRFCKELKNAEKQERQINLRNVVKDIMPYESFKISLKKNPYLAAWLCVPVISYEQRVKSMLDSATKRYEEILTMPLTSKKIKKIKVDGEEKVYEWEDYDMQKVNTWLRLMQQLENRVFGGVVQKQLNVVATRPDDDTAELDEKAIEEKLKELQKKIENGAINV